jgi:bacterioferritin
MSNKPASQSRDPFVMDVQKIRDEARKHMSDGSVTQGYSADKDTVLKLLNDALATEIVCVLRYKRHHFMAKGINSEAVAAEFAEHATEEQEHADRFAERIVQLGGEPDFAPDGLKTRSHSEYKDTYRAIIHYLGENDITTRRIFEEVLAVEEEHADDMADLLEGRE